jgi:hypothetical protein
VAEKKSLIYRVRFRDGEGKDPIEVTCQTVRPSELFGLVVLENLIFRDNTKFVILPAEDEARKRFAKTGRIHVPYHQLVMVEEFDEAPADVTKLPFVREVTASPPTH